MYLGRSAPLRFPLQFPFLMGKGGGEALALLYIYVLAKILQNGAKFIQKLTLGFKNHMRNLDNFRQAVESPDSLS